MLILLDRDAVVNEDRAGGVRTPGGLRLLPGAAKAVRALNDAGHLVALIADQAAATEPMMEQTQDALRADLAKAGARLDHIETSRDQPGASLIRAVLTRLRASPAESVMIGDGLRALETALDAGIARILVRTGQGARTQALGLPPHILPVSVYDDLFAAAAALTGSGEER